MLGWKDGFVPHSSHKMSEYVNTIRTPASTARFYDVSTCKACELETGISVAGEYYELGLDAPCCEADDEQSGDNSLTQASKEASDKVYPPLWLIWAMSNRSPEYHLRAICTTQAITDQKRKYINGLEEIVHVRVEKVVANHLFGDGMIRQV